jgi:hypothetical protein
LTGRPRSGRDQRRFGPIFGSGLEITSNRAQTTRCRLDCQAPASISTFLQMGALAASVVCSARVQTSKRDSRGALEASARPMQLRARPSIRCQKPRRPSTAKRLCFTGFRARAASAVRRRRPACCAGDGGRPGRRTSCLLARFGASTRGQAKMPSGSVASTGTSCVLPEPSISQLAG